MNGSDWSTALPFAHAASDLLEASEEGLMLIDSASVIRFASPTATRYLDLPLDPRGLAVEDCRADYRLVRMLTTVRSDDGVVESHWVSNERELAVRAKRLDIPSPGVIVWVRDETRVRHLEKMRRDFISNVSHELRTPLAAMRLMAETLLSGALDDPPAAHEFVSRIGLEVEQMAQMVEELLELSALEGGEVPTPDEAVAVVELLHAIDRLRPLIEDKHIDLVFDVPPDTAAIRGDLGHLQHVLRNLVHNAVKFTPPRGTITVSARSADGQVVLRVADTGIGILSDDVPRIFERFWKADSSRRRDGEGSGLGLAIARHVVAAHQGSIRVDSQPGQGACFTVTLPAWPATPG